jgi:chemotaxis protein methyltransferase CheR
MPPTATAGAALQALKAAVIARTGLAYYADKDAALARAVAGRLKHLRLADLEGYLPRLKPPGGEAEWQELIDAITIGETHFFRYAAQFDALRDLVVPDCLARRQAERRLRIWSAGCACGPEPYSVALLLDHVFGYLLSGWEVGILGTDINRRELERAEQGAFSEWDLRDLPEAFRARYFERAGRGLRLLEPYRRRVEFRLQNLLDDGLEFARRNQGQFDIVLCRNVMIYFDPEGCRRLLAALHEALAEDGWLIVGHAEPHFEIANLFQPLSAPGTTLYRKQVGASVRPARPVLPPLTIAAPVWPDPTPGPVPSPEPPPPVQDTTTPPVAPPPAAAAPADPMTEVRQVANAGDWPRAEALCLARLQQDSLDADAHFLLGLVLGQRGDPAGSEASLKRAVYLDRRFALAHYHLGMAAAARGDAAAARRALRNVHDVIEPLPETTAVRAGDGLSAAELGGLVELQLGALEARR